MQYPLNDGVAEKIADVRGYDEMIMRFEVANAVADTVNPEFEKVVRTMERATELGGMTGGKKAADEAAAADLIINP